mgnify:CR=1 FL=1
MMHTNGTTPVMAIGEMLCHSTEVVYILETHIICQLQHPVAIATQMQDPYMMGGPSIKAMWKFTQLALGPHQLQVTLRGLELNLWILR